MQTGSCNGEYMYKADNSPVCL